MKSKKFFILALAAAVLFAFAACQPSAPVYRNVSFITIEQTGDAITGIKTEESAFTVTATYTDSTVGEVKADITVDDSSKKATATLKAVNAQGEVVSFTDDVDISYISLTDVAFSQTEFTAVNTADGIAETVAQLNEDIDSGVVSVTLNYKDGSVALADVETTATTYLGVIVDGVEKIGQDAVTALTGKTGTYPIIVSTADYASLQTNATITVDEKPEAVFDHYELQIVNEAWLGDSITWNIIAIDSNNERMSESYSSTDFPSNFQIISGTLPNEGKFAANEVTVKALKITGENAGAEVNMTFPKGNDYILAEPTVTPKANYTFEKGKTVTKDGFDVKVKWASAPDNDVAFTGTWDLASDSYTVTGDPQDIYYNLVWNNKGEDTPVFKSVKINAEG